MKNRRWLWFPAVSAAAILQTAGGTAWPVTVLTAIGAFALLCLPEADPCPKWLGWLKSLWNGVILGQVLSWAVGYWQTAPVWAAGVILALALWLSGKGKNAVAAAGSIFGLLQLLLTGGVLLAALPEVQPRNWTWHTPVYSGWLLTALLIPALGERRKDVGAGLWAAAVSLITTGVAGLQGGYYEMSKSVSILGGIKRLESLAAVGLTLGFLLLSTRLIETESREQSLASAALGAVLYFGGWQCNAYLAGIGSTVLWVLLPCLVGIRVKKRKNGE